jgi:hypothetical protein
MRKRPDKKDRLGSIRDLDAAAMVSRQASCAVLLDGYRAAAVCKS